jgi:hypothetical protein
VPRQIGNEPPLVFAIRHGACDEQFQVFGIHAGIIARRFQAGSTEAFTLLTYSN